MQYITKEAEFAENAPIREPLEALIKGLGFSLVELTIARHRGSVQVRAAIYKREGVSLDDCSKAHRAIMPRLELAFSGKDIYLEVTSPGIERLIKDGAEFVHYKDRGVRCYCTDISDWTKGILKFADEKGIILKTLEGDKRLEFDIIAKAKLYPSEEA